MKFITIFMLAVFTVLSGDGSNVHTKLAEGDVFLIERKPPKDLNVIGPLNALKDAYNNFIDNLDIVKLLVLLVDIFYDCLQPTLPPQTLPSANNSHIDSSLLEQIVTKLPNLQTYTNLALTVPDGFCSTPEFESIHTFVWKEDKQFEDLVHFFGRFGYAKIYDDIRTIYTDSNCPAKFLEDLPKAPTERKYLRTKRHTSGGTNIRDLLTSSNDIHQEGPKCNVMDIISKVPETGLIQLFQFIETVMYQFNTNHNLHFLIGKIQEPIKGKSVRKFRELPAVKGIIKQAHDALKEHKIWSQIFEIIKDAVGIDLFLINPYEFLISLFEFLVWGTPFPSTFSS